MKKIAIIGAGPAGMMAALAAKAQGAQVVLFDTNPVVGKKLAIAGGTRCNITHLGSAEELASHYHEAERFLLSSLTRFDGNRLRDFFRSRLGLATIAETDGRVFPEAQSGTVVAERFHSALVEAGVLLSLGQQVQELSLTAAGLAVDKELFGAVILCTGGRSYPATGSSGWGFDIAAQLGHEVTPLLPGLSGLQIAEEWLTRLSGVRLDQAGLKLLSQPPKKHPVTEGELLFTHFGLSGPAALNMSRWVAKAVHDRSQAELQLDFLPQFNQEQLLAELVAASARNAQVQLKKIIKSYLPEAVAVVACTESGIDPTRLGGNTKRTDLLRLADFLKRAPLTVTELRPLAAAKVTVGGIKLREVDPKTLASKKVARLYLAGEILDLDGQSGGYNLQAAFSTGFAAGTFAAQN